MITNFFYFCIMTIFTFFIGRGHLTLYKNLNIEFNLISLNLVSGLFIIGSVTFIANFFTGINNNFFYLILILIFLFSIVKNLLTKKLFFISSKHILFLILIIFFLVFYANQLPPGYDAGLYHLPHQLFIRDEKIIVGLVNMHERFGLSTFFNYIASLLWLKDNFNLLAIYQSLFLLIFFIFLYELIDKNLKSLSVFVIVTLLTIPIWFRYNVPGFSLVDLSYGVFFFLSVSLSLLVLFEEKKIKQNTYLFFFILSCSLAFMHKSNGAILSVLMIVIFIYLIKCRDFSFFNILSFLIFPSIIVFLWIIRTFIISGCLVYPLEFTCFNFYWVPAFEASETLLSIKNWAHRGFDFINLGIYLVLLLFIIFLTFIILILKKNKNFFNFLFSNKYFLIISLCFLTFVYFNAENLSGYSSLISEKKNFEVKLILVKEITLIISSILFGILTSVNLSKLNHDSFLQYNKNNFICILPFIFIIFYFVTWFFTAPNPRFAIGGFALLGPLVAIFFFPNFKTQSSVNFNLIAQMILIFFVLKISIFDAYINDNLKFIKKKVPTINVIKRSGFGFKPENISLDNRCWIVKNCYFKEKDISVSKTIFGYKVFID